LASHEIDTRDAGRRLGNRARRAQGGPQRSVYRPCPPLRWTGWPRTMITREGSDDGPEGARVLAGLRSGDGPLSIRVRPSSLERYCDRRTTSTGEKCLVNVHAKSRLTLEPLRTLRSEDKGQAGACPDRTRAIPCLVQAVTRQFPEERDSRRAGPRPDIRFSGRG
jgi:hypothetical protein